VNGPGADTSGTAGTGPPSAAVTGITAACQADQAVAFAVPSGSGDFTPEPPRATAGGPAAYRAHVRALKALPEGSGITWYQELFDDGGPFTPVLGVAERVYGDSSTLNVLIRTDPPAGSPGQFEIAASLIITRPGDPGGQRKIDYVLQPGAATVTREDDNSYGMRCRMLLAAVTETARRLVNANLSEQVLETHLGAALAEASLAEQGLNPSLDPQVEQLRAADEDYRRGSDDMRSAAANRELAGAFGVGDQPAGTTEIAALGGCFSACRNCIRALETSNMRLREAHAAALGERRTSPGKPDGR
jgi:hypothetical protein